MCAYFAYDFQSVNDLQELTNLEKMMEAEF